MGEVNVNFTQSDEGDEARRYRLIPEGVYPAKVWDVKEQVSKKSGKPMLFIDFKLEHPAYSKRHAFDTFSLQQQALWRLAKFMQLLGLDHSGAVTIDFDRDLIGKNVLIVLEHKQISPGKVREEIVDYREAEQSESDPYGGGDIGDDVPF